MVSLIKCSRCGSTLDPTRVGEGQPLACEFCGEVNRAPVTVPGVKGAVYELLDSALAEMPPPPPPPPPKRKLWPLIATAALGLAVFGVAVLLLLNAIREPARTAGPLTSALETAAASSPPGERAHPVWTPDWEMLERLETRVRFGQWSWCLPDGFVPTKSLAAPGIYKGDMQCWAWGDIRGSDAMLAAFHLDSGEMRRLHDPRKAMVDAATLDAVLLDRIKLAIKATFDLSDVEFKLAEPGRLARRDFQRLDFTGKNDRKVLLHGVFLFSRVERSLLMLAAIAPWTPDDERHAEMVAALLSLD